MRALLIWLLKQCLPQTEEKLVWLREQLAIVMCEIEGLLDDIRRHGRPLR